MAAGAGPAFSVPSSCRFAVPGDAMTVTGQPVRQDVRVDAPTATEPTVLILTALPVEMIAVLAHFEPGTSRMAGPVLCELRTFAASNGLTWRVVAVELGPGTVDTAAAVVNAASEFRPDVLMFVGIAGALKSEVTIGDVVAGTEVAWTERGKWSDPGYLPRIRTVSLSAPLSQWARKVARDNKWVERLKQPRPHTAKAFIAQIASGEKVIADEEYRGWLRKTFSDAYAIENEGFALARAGEMYAGGERFVIRGISDAADGSKSDQGQSVAADAAAAFAVELIDAYSIVQATVVPVTGLAQHGLQEITSRGEQADDILMLAHELINDVDLINDDRGQVEDLARRVVANQAAEDVARLLGKVGTALGDKNGPIIQRRLFWFGRQLVRSAGAAMSDWPLEAGVRTAPVGMAMLLTEPAGWAHCGDGARRRCLTALIGPSDPAQPAPLGSIQLIMPLLKAGLLEESEARRVQASFDLTSLELLAAGGVTLDVLVPRIIADLELGDFTRQNTAARFLYGLSPEVVNSQPIPATLDFSLGAKLVEATIGVYHSWGADEAMAWPYVSDWPPSRLQGGIWAAVSLSSGRFLRLPPSPHLPNLIAAAAGKSVLHEILENVAEMLDSSLQQLPGEDFEWAGRTYLALAEKYTGDDQTAIISFVDHLRTQVSDQ
jgi:adenosylhomocysteine nucleosidase